MSCKVVLEFVSNAEESCNKTTKPFFPRMLTQEAVLGYRGIRRCEQI